MALNQADSIQLEIELLMENKYNLNCQLFNLHQCFFWIFHKIYLSLPVISFRNTFRLV